MATKVGKKSKQQRTVAKVWLIDWIAGLIASSLLFIGCYFLIMSHTTQLFGLFVTHVETNEKVVALTFDDGPQPVYTDQILATLAARNVKATFYVIGVENVRYPNELKKIVASGNDVGNHSYNHYPLVFKTQQQIAADIQTNDALIRAAGYKGLITFRAPFSAKFIGLPWYLAQHHRVSISRDVAPDELSPAFTSSREMAAYAIAHTKPGSIILLHAMYGWSGLERGAIGPIIDGLQAKGYKFVTISQLLNAGTPK